MPKRRTLASLLAPALAALATFAAAPPSWAEVVERDHIRVELVAAQDAVVPGQPLTVALRLEPDAHWHTYWVNPGDSGLPTRIDWDLPAGTRAGPIRWPFPERQSLGPLTNYGYSGEHFLLTTLTPPASLAGDTFTVAAQAHWLVCDDVCIPGEAPVQLTLPVAGTASPSRWADKIATALARVPAEVQFAAQFDIVDGQLRLQADHPSAPAVVRLLARIGERRDGPVQP